MKRHYKFIGVFFLFVFLFLGFTYYYKVNMRLYNKSEVYFIVKQGDSINKIAEYLLNKKVIRSKNFFLYYAKIKGFDRNIMVGNYIISTNKDLDFLFKKLTSGKSDFAIVTIPEGYNLYQIAKKLEEKGLLKKEDLLNAKISDFDKEGLIQLDKNAYYELEGYLYPDTYYIPYNLTSKEIINIMFERFINKYKPFIKRQKELNLSLREVITIASLIEKESYNDEERRRISGVIYNRLQRNMPLQIDATVIYAITKGEKHINRLYYKDYKFESPYNTYKIIGLPPGPIASPGIKSIEAALNPEKHQYLYYVLSGNGHVFSKTYEEHIKNVHKYIQ
ncbi:MULTISPECIES: endolytic transglycosylase MltG [Caloramator]|uniref:Endolytic murein transglycosylase n=1 Tax=Caloramator australicus RC3 TaxID=857293 RepID=G0V492_9CLOT|nr:MULTISPECIES: endolytic transglycosylase MltG [Caloramator]MDO6354933.1 endolytic transglycosylase MltG [Caloramator sp. CAR-1]CCC57932.1 FIG004453: protein YceG like [Caloramator australicus RC3]